MIYCMEASQNGLTFVDTEDLKVEIISFEEYYEYLRSGGICDNVDMLNEVSVGIRNNTVLLEDLVFKAPFGEVSMSQHSSTYIHHSYIYDCLYGHGEDTHFYLRLAKNRKIDIYIYHKGFEWNVRLVTDVKSNPYLTVNGEVKEMRTALQLIRLPSLHIKYFGVIKNELILKMSDYIYFLARTDGVLEFHHGRYEKTRRFLGKPCTRGKARRNYLYLVENTKGV